jgi:uncharacterized membrane protein YjfL (UPF0719 family)
VVQPAIAQAALPGETANAQLQAEQQAASAATSTGSITTIILWAAIAFAIVLLVSDVKKI